MEEDGNAANAPEDVPGAQPPTPPFSDHLTFLTQWGVDVTEGYIRAQPDICAAWNVATKEHIAEIVSGAQSLIDAQNNKTLEEMRELVRSDARLISDLFDLCFSHGVSLIGLLVASDVLMPLYEMADPTVASEFGDFDCSQLHPTIKKISKMTMLLSAYTLSTIAAQVPALQSNIEVGVSNLLAEHYGFTNWQCIITHRASIALLEREIANYFLVEGRLVTSQDTLNNFTVQITPDILASPENIVIKNTFAFAIATAIMHLPNLVALGQNETMLYVGETPLTYTQVVEFCLNLKMAWPAVMAQAAVSIGRETRLNVRGAVMTSFELLQIAQRTTDALAVLDRQGPMEEQDQKRAILTCSINWAPLASVALLVAVAGLTSIVRKLSAMK